MEIERKFLLDTLPDNLDRYKCLKMEQAYISTHPVIRIRQQINDSTAKYFLTVKSTGLMTRQEYELEIDPDEYNNLLTKAEGNIITKNRYIIPLNDSLTLELDVFKDSFAGLVIGEIEFPDEECAKKYTPPAYLSEEVTFDSKFHNSSLSTMAADEISKLIFSTHQHN